MTIKIINIVTAMGANTHEIGEVIGDAHVKEIRKEALYISGDPYDHYCGYDEGGKMLFSVNCLCPCEVYYL